MNREIKFRAWLPKHEFDISDEPEFNMVYDLAFEEYAPINDLLNKVNNLMQYTGIKDKNGVEIYEGDIIKNNLGNKLTVTDIRFDIYSFDLDDDSLEYEVIGNIYEHPHLIK